MPSASGLHDQISSNVSAVNSVTLITHAVLFQSGSKAGMFEHVVKMSRLSPPGSKRTSGIPPLRFRSAIHPMTDLSSLPPTHKTPLITKDEELSSSGSDSESGRKSNKKKNGKGHMPKVKLRKVSVLEMPVKFQSDTIIIKSNLVASRFLDIWVQDV